MNFKKPTQEDCAASFADMWKPASLVQHVALLTAFWLLGGSAGPSIVGVLIGNFIANLAIRCWFSESPEP